MISNIKLIDEVLSVSNEISSNQFTLNKLLQFHKKVCIQVPLYQRLYVWTLEEVKLFIEDVSDAYIQGKKTYYIGNMMFANKQTDEHITIDLIDGQQRFTTLWLTAILLGKYNSDLKKFAFLENAPRLTFVSRPKVNDFFTFLQTKEIDVLDNQNLYFGDLDSTIEPLKNGLENIFNSIKEVVSKYNWGVNTVERFANYIYFNLIMVQTTVPPNNDVSSPIFSTAKN